MFFIISTFKFHALSQLEFAFFILWFMVGPSMLIGGGWEIENRLSVNILMLSGNVLVNCTKEVMTTCRETSDSIRVALSQIKAAQIAQAHLICILWFQEATAQSTKKR